MSHLDAEKSIELIINGLDSEYTPVQVEIPYLNKIIEVKVPNNVQEGHKIRLEGLGYADASGIRGDYYLVISKIKRMYGNQEKMIVVEHNDFDEVNEYLEYGWKVKEFKPFKDSNNLYVYVLIEKK